MTTTFETFIGANFDNYRRILFIDSPDQKSFCFRTYWYAYTPSLALLPFEQVLELIKKHCSWNCIPRPLYAIKFDNGLSTLFVDNQDQKLFVFQNLLGCIHSYSSPHSIWPSPWPDWKILFVKLHTKTFIGNKIWQRHFRFFIGANFHNDMSIVFIDYPDQKPFCFRTYWYAYTPTLALITFEQVLDLIEKHCSWNCITRLFWAIKFDNDIFDFL